MCGIAGKYYLNKEIFYEEDLDRMLSTIFHRGPDSEGRYRDGRVVIGFRRLSIIDVQSGDQPLFNEDKEIVLFVNGEIYNYKELKRNLEEDGHIFRTRSDCEVLVHLYEDIGEEFVNELNGMFAFCLYDKRNETMIVGRDRVGIKPLYYTQIDRTLIFASEIKAILQAEEVNPIEEANVLAEYLCFRFLSGERTFFSGIKLVQPGQVLVATPTGIDTQEYWHPRPNTSLSSKDKIVQLIRTRMYESVSRQLMADVPVGTQLSGGVDSSWVSFVAGMEAGGIKSFSIGFEDERYDERKEAKLVAQMGNIEYHELLSESDAFFEMLPRIIWHNDEPLAHANSVEIFNLCRYAREHVKVLLTGEGADELFGGYPRYNICRLAEYYNSMPSPINHIFKWSVDFLAKGRGKVPSRFFGMSPRDLVFWNSVFADPSKVAWLMDQETIEFNERRKLLGKVWVEELGLLENLLLFEFRSYLEPILLRQDKMSMGASIEARVPILDNTMVDLAFSIPANKKITHFRLKYLFKKAASRDLPSKIVFKRKIGFGVPVGLWLRNNGTLSKRVDLLIDNKSRIPGVNPLKVEQIVYEHKSGHRDHEDVLWPLLNYVLWRDIFFN